eukprot:CAMPEP_0197610688 /NCGR_PEP_ID=MMETSP1326-20131121/53881_1 /TAXON_ID=1155430 /ORGANISM="Genus nov. species nov., Strain RCC2288" /LENGTH=68 /DNA_ID=CAMNT_0043179237 /DNA_START=234 /DNA_END=441 /DNA_ORIENTATION=-
MNDPKNASYIPENKREMAGRPPPPPPSSSSSSGDDSDKKSINADPSRVLMREKILSFVNDNVSGNKEK